MEKMDYKVYKDLGVVKSGDFPILLRVVAWKNQRPKADLRTWKITEEECRPLRGLTLSAADLRNLRNILNEMNLDEMELIE